jgi:hypothetical protein
MNIGEKIQILEKKILQVSVLLKAFLKKTEPIICSSGTEGE